MTYLLFPGRHHVLTNFQAARLRSLALDDPANLHDINDAPLEANIDAIVWAITSANHANTRRNPVPGHRREAAIEALSTTLPVPSLVYHVDDTHTTPRFAEYVLKKIEADGGPHLTPENTVIGCSTPEVIEMYERLGFRVTSFELADRATRTFSQRTPWSLLEEISRDPTWRTNEHFLTDVHPASQRLFLRYNLGDRIVELHEDPLLGNDGDITETREYNTYFRAFDEGAQRKYALLAPHVVPGRIVDIGCCTGSLIREMTLDTRLRESDFYGVEAARRLYEECLHRKHSGFFANDNVFFHQRNIARGDLFKEHSVNTFTTVSLTHEILSYQGADALDAFVDSLSRQTAIGGRWLNLDVVGPEEKSKQVYMWLNDGDGVNDDIYRACANAQELKTHLEGLSTAARFQRFARDFRAQEGERVEYELATIGDRTYVVTDLETAAEFMSKKDYTDNWQSEMHERFCRISFSDWKERLTSAGFQVHSSSHTFLNPWIVEHRYAGAVELYEREGDALHAVPYPDTNVLLVGEMR